MAEQSYIEDCPVCCKPMAVSYIASDGEVGTQRRSGRLSATEILDRLSSRSGPQPRAVFKRLRISFLLVVLLLVSVTTCEDRYRSTRGAQPLYVAIYPIAADDSSRDPCLLGVSMRTRFKPIDEFFAARGPALSSAHRRTGEDPAAPRA